MKPAVIHFSFRVAVYLLLFQDDHILLLRRYNTGWMDGSYSLVAGHLEKKETIKMAMMREAGEEAGVNIQEKDLHIVHVMHRVSKEHEYIDFFLTTKFWKGNIENKEKDKCDDLRFFPLASLPKNLLPNVRYAIKNFQQHKHFSEYFE